MDTILQGAASGHKSIVSQTKSILTVKNPAYFPVIEKRPECEYLYVAKGYLNGGATVWTAIACFGLNATSYKYFGIGVPIDPQEAPVVQTNTSASEPIDCDLIVYELEAVK